MYTRRQNHSRSVIKTGLCNISSTNKQSFKLFLFPLIINGSVNVIEDNCEKVFHNVYNPIVTRARRRCRLASYFLLSPRYAQCGQVFGF